MKRHHLKSLLTLLATCLLVFTSNGFAGEDRAMLTDRDGFCASLPQGNRETLTLRIQHNRNQLVWQQSNLSKRVESLKFGKLDTLITLVMPGGLLYAAIRKGTERKEKGQLEQLTQELASLNVDLAMFKAKDASRSLAFK